MWKGIKVNLVRWKKKCLDRIPMYYSGPWEFPETGQWKESLNPLLTGSYVPQTTLNYS